MQQAKKKKIAASLVPTGEEELLKEDYGELVTVKLYANVLSNPAETDHLLQVYYLSNLSLSSWSEVATLGIS